MSRNIVTMTNRSAHPLQTITNARGRLAPSGGPTMSRSFLQKENIVKRKPMRSNKLGKLLRNKKCAAQNIRDESCLPLYDQAWKNAMRYSTSSTSSEEDETTKHEIISRIRKRLNSFDSDSDSSSEYTNMRSFSNIFSHQKKTYNGFDTSFDSTSTFSPAQQSCQFVQATYLSPQIKCANMREGKRQFLSPRMSAQARMIKSGVVQSQSQLKLVVCGSTKKLTVTVLGLKSLPQPPTAVSPSTFVYLKFSLSPDGEEKTRHQTNPEIVTSDSVNLHDTFTFDICRRDVNRRLLVSAWSKAEDHSRSTFIGCTSFGIRNIINNHEVIQGWYYFLRESIGRKKHLKAKNFTAERNFTSPRSHRSKSRDRSRSIRHVYSSESQYINMPAKRRCSSRSGSSDSSLNSIYGKQLEKSTSQFEAVNSEEELVRQRRRLSKLHKRRRVSTGLCDTMGRKMQCTPHVRKTQQAVNQQGTPEKVISPQIMRHEIGKAVEKRSSEAVGYNVRKLGTKTPTGRKYLQRKQYSSTDLIASRMSYCVQNEDDDVFYSKPIAGDDNDSARENSDDLNCSFSPAKKSKLDTCGEEFVTASLLPNRYGEVAKCLNLSTTNSVSSIHKPAENDEIKVDASPKSNDQSPNNDSDDRGYHSDVGASAWPIAENKIVSPKCQTVTISSARCPRNKRRARLSLDFVPQSPRLGSKTMENLLKTCDEICELDTKELEAENCEKSRPSALFSIKTWLQRKSNDESKSFKQTSSDVQFKRSSSIRKSKKGRCDGCFFTAKNLTELLSKKGGTTALRNFLQSEYSEENIDFWLECENYKNTKSYKQRKVAQKIFERFLAANSPNEINIDAKTRTHTESQLSNPTHEMFNEAQQRIFKLMEKDSFRRFLSSEYSHKCKS